MQQKDLLGKWSVFNLTKLFEGKNNSDICNILNSFESGQGNINGLISTTLSGNEPSITVEILSGGEMKMAIIQSMHPDMHAKMNINAVIKWKLNEANLTTETNVDTLKVRIDLDAGYSFPADKLAALDADTLQNMKNSPQWSKPNTVSVIYCGKKSFLTSSENGILMLHHRK